MTPKSGRKNRKGSERKRTAVRIGAESISPGLPLPLESFPAEIVTVAWMVCTVFTMLVNLVLLAFGTAWISGYRDPQGVLLGRLVLGAGILVAPVTLVLTYFVRRLRKLAPPPSLVLAAILGSVFPFGLLLILVLGV